MKKMNLTTRWLVAAFSLLGTSSSFSSTNLLLLTPTRFQDGSIQLKWQSETGAVYSVESIGALTEELQFIVRDDRIVSQGAQTTWLDYGNAAHLPRIYHPIDTDDRYYRVRKVDQASGLVSVSILQPTNTTVSGDVPIEVAVNTTNAVGLIRLFVDGQPVDDEFGVDTWQFSINTTEWFNGPHVIHVTAELLGEIGTTGAPETSQAHVGSSAPLTLNFDNLIHDFTVVNPFFDPYDPFFPEFQVVYAALTEACDWTVDIVDANDVPVDGFAGSGTSIYIEWDGTDFFGNPLPPGFYDYILTATKQGGSFAMQSSSMSDENAMTTRYASARLKNSPVLIQDTAERSAQIAAINQTRATGPADAIRSIRVPQGDAASQRATFAVTSRVPWFMQPKPDEAAAADEPFTPIIPPIPPLIEPEIKPADWDAQVAEYLQMSNNIVASAYEAAGQLNLKRQELKAAQTESNQSAMQTAADESGEILSAFAANSQSTRNPRRERGRTQMSWVGGIGVMSQGHHPKTNSAPWSYGPLNKANVIAKLFVEQMEKGHKQTGFPSWKRSFLLTDDQVKKTNVVGTGYSNGNIITSNSWFNSRANIGMLVGHTLEYNPPGWPQGIFGPLAAYPLYQTSNPGGYTWIPDGEMRFGSQYLKWMAYYGCNVLTRSRWFGGAKDHFIWPLNPSLNLYLATGSTIYMYDEMGRLWAKGMQGILNGTPMRMAPAWVEAGRRSHAEVAKSLAIDTIRMSYLYWDARQEGGAYTIQDRLHPFEANFSLIGRSYENLEYDDPVVYSP